MGDMRCALYICGEGELEVGRELQKAFRQSSYPCLPLQQNLRKSGQENVEYTCNITEG